MTQRCFERQHYDLIAVVLLAGDVRARAIHNDSGTSVVAVKLVDGGEVVWGNRTGPDDMIGQPWSYTVVRPDGTTEGERSLVPADADPEDVAHAIAVHEYPAPMEFTESGA